MFLHGVFAAQWDQFPLPQKSSISLTQTAKEGHLNETSEASCVYMGKTNWVFCCGNLKSFIGGKGLWLLQLRDQKKIVNKPNDFNLFKTVIPVFFSIIWDIYFGAHRMQIIKIRALNCCTNVLGYCYFPRFLSIFISSSFILLGATRCLNAGPEYHHFKQKRRKENKGL